MKKHALLIMLLLSIYAPGFCIPLPDEGLWLPMFIDRLNYVDMQKMGLRLTPDELYSINHSSLKDAIVGLAEGSAPDGFFCTSELVSDEGLLFTNHHCGYSSIQKHSSVNHDYLTDGFWAMNKSEELPNEGLTASFLVRMEDVTTKVLAGVNDTMPERTRSSKIRDAITKLTREGSEQDKYQAIVKDFYNGNEYYLFVYQTYKDVRLVGAPPSSIGKFGGDTDNWMWPRHTGDFSIFRIYTAADGSSSEYLKTNIPLVSMYHLPISLKGVKKDDFAMIWGYPGNTDRFLTSYGVTFTQDYTDPALTKLMGKKLEIWKNDMDADKSVNLKYSSKYEEYANAWKNFIGEVKGLKRLDVKDLKKGIEDDFTKWVQSDPKRKEKYGDCLNQISSAYSDMETNILNLYYLSMGAYRGAEIFGLAAQFNGLVSALEEGKKVSDESLKNIISDLRQSVTEFYQDYEPRTDAKVMAAMFRMCSEVLPKEYLPDIFARIAKKYKGNYENWSKDVFDESIFTSTEKITRFLEKPKLRKLLKDPVWVCMNQSFEKLIMASGNRQASRRKLASGERIFVAGLREMNPNKMYYPDANSTLRFTYGSVKDYYPADAVHYDYVTHIEGIMEKEDPSNEEFVVPAKLKELYRKKDYGPYGSNGDLIVCFLTNNDITGGNSGSPVLNGNGELIGLAFDGNWEAMSSNIAFEPALQRTICVDIRYVLFVIDKFAGARNIIKELTIKN